MFPSLNFPLISVDVPMVVPVTITVAFSSGLPFCCTTVPFTSFAWTVTAGSPVRAFSAVSEYLYSGFAKAYNTIANTGSIKNTFIFLYGDMIIFFIISNLFLVSELLNEFARLTTGEPAIWFKRVALYTAGSDVRCSATSSAIYSWFCLMKRT